VIKLPIFLLAGGAAALAGTAIAATNHRHVMNVPLPDGAMARIEYAGNIRPKVTIAPAQQQGDNEDWGGSPSFASFDRMFEQMDRQMHAIQQMARQPAGVPGMNVASYGNLPVGANSVSVVSFSNGGNTCTRTTEIVSQGAGKPPKVTNSVSGNCGAAPQAAPGRPINRT
jgi:hypothetical protein